jgi:serine/threonine-protein kinase
MGVTEGSGVGQEWPTAGAVLSLRYRLREKLAISGMSEVWRADDKLLGRSVAIKLPSVPSADVMDHAWIEARTAARLSDPHIAAVHDYGEATRPDGSVAPFVVMELLDGESLAARLTSGPLTWREAARIGAEVASGLATAHARQVVHRDIKPGNIMLTPTGAKILDFGISTVTGAPDDDETGATFGTPAYVAPERLDGTPAEPATDVYALGSVLFEMVNGEPPYPVDTWEEYAAARATPPGRLPDGLPAAFRELVDRCLAEDPTRRPAAAEVRNRLSALLTPDGPLRSAVSAAGRVPARTVALIGRPLPAAVRVAMVVLLIVAGGAAVGLWSWSTGGTDAPTAIPDRSEPSPPVTATVTATATAPAPSGTPTTGAPPPPSGATGEPPAEPTGEPVLGLAEAVDSVISAVQAGQVAGEIREDVAVDLINLLRQLDATPPQDVSHRVDELRRKISDRVGEGGLTKTYADELHDRLDRVAVA